MGVPYKNLNEGSGKNCNEMLREPSKRTATTTIMEDGAPVNVNPDSPESIPWPPSVAVTHTPIKKLK